MCCVLEAVLKQDLMKPRVVLLRGAIPYSCPQAAALSGVFVSPHSIPSVRFGKLPVSVWGFFLPWNAVDEAQMFCTSSSATNPWRAFLRWFHSKLSESLELGCTLLN